MVDSRDSVLVKIKALMLDPSSNLPIVVLHDPASDRYLPIWIGLFEAQAIAMSLEGIEAPRPMTHDLFHRSLTDLGARILHVVVSDLQDSTFHAQIHLERDGKVQVLDARPSDAIALALRAEASVLVNPDVLDKALAGDMFKQLGSEEEIRKWLEDASPEDFGKYKM
ncbi:MAG: bifunctional nuclease family protein [Acidobacteriota bacterium]|nr:bifunctional nuclease family protein [Acidobacteriota bacterium]